MGIWTFYDYVEASGRNPFHEWLSELEADAQAYIDDRILAMERMPKWPEKWVSKYSDSPGIFELRIPCNRVQYRPLGMYMPNRSFALLCGAIEKNGKIPKSDVETAEKRRDVLLGDPTRVRRHKFYETTALGQADRRGTGKGVS